MRQKLLSAKTTTTITKTKNKQQTTPPSPELSSWNAARRVEVEAADIAFTAVVVAYVLLLLLLWLVVVVASFALRVCVWGRIGLVCLYVCVHRSGLRHSGLQGNKMGY